MFSRPGPNSKKAPRTEGQMIATPGQKWCWLLVRINELAWAYLKWWPGSSLGWSVFHLVVPLTATIGQRKYQPRVAREMVSSARPMEFFVMLSR